MRKASGILYGAVALSLVLVPVARADAPPKERPKSLGEAAAEKTTPAPEASPSAAPEGGLLKGPATVPPHWSKNKCPDSIPDGATYYIVVKGDTLWDLARRFLGNPYLWPQIWDKNRCIADAHWIYPGDPLIIPEVAVVSERAGEAGGTGTEEAGGTTVGGAAPGTPAEVLVPAIEEMALQCAPYIVDDREDESLRIIGTENGATNIAYADRDIVYLSKGSNAGIKAGDVYTIHHETYTVKHPETQKNIGTKIETLGWLRVILVQENTATATIERTCAEVHLGDYLKVFEPVTVPLITTHAPPTRLTPPSGKVVGTVIDMQDDASIAGERQLLSLNLGTASGIAPGNMVVFYKVMYPSVPTPRVVLGEGVIVAVRERTSIVRVIYSADAIMLGDKVELQ